MAGMKMAQMYSVLVSLVYISTLEVRYRSHKHWQGKLMVQARERH